MKKNKGFIGIGLILVIILGMAVVGGGAYYIGKGKGENKEVKSPENVLPNNEGQTLPTVENTKEEIVTITTPQVVAGCASSSTPSIKVLSPNGGESYQDGDKITVKWEDCNVDSSSTLAVELLYGTDGIMVVFVPNTGSHTFQLSPTALMNPSVKPSQLVRYGKYFKVSVGTPPTTFPSYQDMSDNSFTINSACEAMGCENNSDSKNPPISTTLPQYVNTHPVITSSSKSYSCNNIGVASNTEGNDITAQRVINGRTYCIHSLSDGYAGGRGYTYTYTTSNGNGTKIATLSFTHSSCGVYGGPSEPAVIKCALDQKTFDDGLDTFIDSLI
ncbi:MAG: hypothetical protein RLZZ230_910 [Candidatus Parcubacteria bacterium]|jgi:hypothetical protein